MTFMYGLHDPDTNEPRYVGKSDKPETRYRAHTKDSSKLYKAHWIQSLQQNGKIPKMVIYAEVRNEAWPEAEHLLIAGFREMGYRLTNVTDGGEGPSGCKRSEETKRKMSESKRGCHRTFTEEHKQKLREAGKGEKTLAHLCRINKARKGTTRSEEVKNKISKSLMGHYMSEETRNKIKEKNTGKQRSEEYRRKMSAVKTGVKHTEETKQKLSKINKGKPGRKQSDESKRKISETLKITWYKRRLAGKAKWSRSNKDSNIIGEHIITLNTPT